MTQLTGIVLCAGAGTRLRPLTADRPKPLVPFLDVPIARHAITALVEVGVQRIGINAHHHADAVVAFAERTQGELGEVELFVEVEPILRGTGGGVRGVWEALGRPDGTLAILNGDIVTAAPLDALLAHHRASGALATLLTLPATAGEGNVEVDASGTRIVSLPAGDGGRAQSPRHAAGGRVTFGGVSLVEARALAQLPPDESCLIRQGIAPLLAAGAPIAAYAWTGFWADLGSAERLWRATAEVLAVPSRFVRNQEAVDQAGCFVHPSAVVADDAQLLGPVRIGKGARIGPRAVVGPEVVVGAGCTVEAGAHLTASVLMDGATVEGTHTRTLFQGPLVVPLP